MMNQRMHEKQPTIQIKAKTNKKLDSVVFPWISSDFSGKKNVFCQTKQKKSNIVQNSPPTTFSNQDRDARAYIIIILYYYYLIYLFLFTYLFFLFIFRKRKKIQTTKNYYYHYYYIIIAILLL